MIVDNVVSYHEQVQRPVVAVTHIALDNATCRGLFEM